MKRDINKNNIIILLLTFIIFFPNLLFIILGENTAISSVIKQTAYFSFTFSLILIPLIFIKPKIYFSLFIPLLPFLLFDAYIIFTTYNHTNYVFYQSLLSTNEIESFEFLESNKMLIIIAILVIFIYLLLYLKLDSTFKVNRSYKKMILVASLAVFSVLFFKILTISLDSRSNNLAESIYTSFNRHYIKLSVPYGSINKLSNLFMSEYYMTEFNKKNKEFSYKPEIYSSDNQIVVLVIGETARKCNFQLYNYSRETNPYLSKLKNLIIFKDMTTNANFTYSSFLLNLTSVDPKNFKNSMNEPGIVSAYKEANFYTYWITNQQYDEDFVYQLYAKQSESFIDVSTKNDFYNYDENILPKLKKVLKDKNKKRFIVLHTMGSHYRYNYRYPKGFSKYLPELEGAVTMNKNTIVNNGREEYINSYDNSILYTDYILASIIKELKKTSKNSIMLYFSDHGENIYDDDKGRVLHGGLNPTRYEFEIPMLIWYSDGYNEEVIKKLKSNSDKKISSSVVFHTLSSIGGFKTKLHKNKYDLLSDSLKNGQRYFYLDEDNIVLID